MDKIEFNQIYRGECAQLMSTLPPDCIDLTVTSPPYDNLRDYKGYTFDFEAIAAELYRVTKVGGVVVWVVADATVNGSETGTSFRQALHFMELGFNLHDTMIYEADKPPISAPRYQGKFEFMFVFSKGKISTFNPILVKVSDHPATVDRKKYKSNAAFMREKDGSFIGKKRKHNTGKKIKSNIWKFRAGFAANDKISTSHPAIFPEALARDHILSWSNPGDIVLDPMCGSGTTCKMAKETGRQFLGFDISEEYCEIARKRIRAAKIPLFVEDTEPAAPAEQWEQSEFDT